MLPKISCFQPTSAQASAVSRAFRTKSASCRSADRTSHTRIVPSWCRLSRSGVCSRRRPRRFAGSRSRQGWATSQVTSGRRSSSRTKSCSSPDSRCRWDRVVTQKAKTGMCPDFAFTFGVRVRRSCVTSGRSTHGHTANLAPTSKSHSTSRPGSGTTGAGRFRACEIDSSTRRHLRFCATDSSGSASRGARCNGRPSSMSGVRTLWVDLIAA